MSEKLRQAAQQALEALEENWRTDKSDAAITALRAALAEQPAEQEARRLAEIGWLAIKCPVCGESAQVLAATEAPQPKPAEQEPVAWIMPEHLRHQGKSFTRWIQDGSTKPPIYEGWTPLYTAPQPKREPLTDEEISRATEHITGKHCSVVDQIARAIERAHGIGEPK